MNEALNVIKTQTQAMLDIITKMSAENKSEEHYNHLNEDKYSEYTFMHDGEIKVTHHN